jgi:nicotinamide-nucleotide amidase
MKAEIIASGTELLLGELTDTNTPFIASQLASLGIDLFFISIVGDNYARFSSVLKQARDRSDLVIITGGLGPTKGDITREVIAGLLDEKIEMDTAVKEQITQFFSRLGLEMPENNLKQATRIPSAIVLPNPLGTAPGWWCEKDGRIVVSLPGPPGEMQPMWRQEVFPRLKKRGGAVIVSRTLKTWGISEAKIDQMVGRYMSLPNPTLALYAKSDGIHLRITAKAENKAGAGDCIKTRESELRDILKEAVWGADDDALEESVSSLLLTRGLNLAVAETFTGGLLIYTLSGVKESRRFLKGGLIACDEQARAELKAGKGANADLKSAAILASQTRQRYSADIGIAIDGQIVSGIESIAGQAYIAIASKNGQYDLAKVFPGRPSTLARRSVIQALFSLRNALLAGG